MEKIKSSFAEKLKNVIILLLTASMLFFAFIYIGGSQLISNHAAREAANMPGRAVKVGLKTEEAESLAQKSLLPVSYAAVRSGATGGGAFSHDPAAKVIVGIASEHIHTCLSSESTLVLVDVDYSALLENEDFIAINLFSPLPYQVIYALTGEYISAAGSSANVNADRLLLSYDRDGESVTLFLYDGEKVFKASATSHISISEFVAIANDTRLSDFTAQKNGVFTDNVTPSVPKISFLNNIVPETDARSGMLTCLGYNPNTASSLAAEDAFDDAFIDTVSPLGALVVKETFLSYTAAKDNGIPLSNYLKSFKNESEMSLDDILLASVTVVEELKKTAPDIFGGTLSLHIDGVYYESGLYTVVIGANYDGTVVSGEKFPYFAEINVKNGRFESIYINLISEEPENLSTPLFPSEWCYCHAAQNSDIDSFYLRYDVDFSGNRRSPEWTYTERAVAVK